MKRIGIMGAPADNPNHGCMALLYSLLVCLNRIESESEDAFQYIIFDWKYNKDRMRQLAEETEIPEEKLQFAPYVMLTDPVRGLYHANDLWRMQKAIRQCDCIIDVTEGDSFSDIYGDTWFRGRTRVKLLVERLGVPLLLAPQTYGPYLKEKNRLLAAKAIKGAELVMSRDGQGVSEAAKLAGKEVIHTADLAFLLPCRDYSLPETEKVRVGLNASNLLYFHDEMKSRKFELSVSYREYIRKCLEELLLDGRFEIYLISHVDDDYRVHEELKEQYPQARLMPIFHSPVQAKSCISRMDVFIGARMHGTIAAFTTGIACIPTSYSLKFASLFSGLGYPVNVDLCTSSTEEAVRQTLEYVNQYEKLREQVNSCQKNYQEYVKRIAETFGTWLQKL